MSKYKAEANFTETAGERTNATEVRPERALVGVTIEEESAVEEGAAITESVVYKCPSSGTSDWTLNVRVAGAAFYGLFHAVGFISIVQIAVSASLNTL